MALNYPSFVVPQPSKTSMLDVLDIWNKSEAQGREKRFEDEAPDQFAKSLPPLSEFGLATPADELKAMFANPNTRALAISQVQEASQRRADSMDPMKQLQLKKAQYEAANLGRVDPTAEMRNYQAAANDPKFAEFIKAKGADNAPADVKEYLWYRENETAAGRQPLSYLEFGQAQRGPGLSMTTNPDGTVSVTQGGTGPKLTEGQSKDAFYYIRGSGANDALAANEGALTSLKDTMVNGIPLAGNYFTSDGFKNANRDGKEFLAAVLRKDSGGAITPDEWQYYGPMYLPAPGDTPDQLTRKREARDRAMDALRMTSGPGQVVIDEYARQKQPPDAAAASEGARPTKTLNGKSYYQDENGDWYEE